MSIDSNVRQKLKDFGFRPNIGHEIDKMGAQLTICQLIVVVLSVSSIVFLFIPFFYIQNLLFVISFLVLSMVCILFGVWFWLHRSEICEHPEDFQD